MASPLPDMAAEKRRLRALALQRRAAMGEEARAAASRAAVGHALAAMGRVQDHAVALFAPFRDEIDTHPLAAALRAKGARLALPVIVARNAPLLFRRWDEDDPLAPEGAYAIPTPRAEAPVLVPDLVVVPLAAFDRRGFRVGYGAGFYDRTLARLRAERPVRALGFAFACQEMDEVPAEPHDEPLDLMVTERLSFSCPGT